MPKSSVASPDQVLSEQLPALVFDWGMRHVGTALITSTTRIAVPLTTIPAKGGQVDHKDLDQLLDEHKPMSFIVGLPCNMDGSESTETKRSRRFGEHLKEHYNKPVDYVDERLTTREAIDRMNSTSADHSIAALVIAESWLNSH